MAQHSPEAAVAEPAARAGTSVERPIASAASVSPEDHPGSS